MLTPVVVSQTLKRLPEPEGSHITMDRQVLADRDKRDTHHSDRSQDLESKRANDDKDIVYLLDCINDEVEIVAWQYTPTLRSHPSSTARILHSIKGDCVPIHRLSITTVCTRFILSTKAARRGVFFF